MRAESRAVGRILACNVALGAAATVVAWFVAEGGLAFAVALASAVGGINTLAWSRLVAQMLRVGASGGVGGLLLLKFLLLKFLLLAIVLGVLVLGLRLSPAGVAVGFTVTVASLILGGLASIPPNDEGDGTCRTDRVG